jgi:hypothetical protein
MARDEQGKFVSTNQKAKSNSTKAVKSLSGLSSTSKIRFPLKLGFNLTTLVILIIVVAGAAGSAYFYNNYQSSQEELDKLKKDPNTLARQESKDLVDKVGKLVELPKGENPTIATVADKSKLAKQPFFAKAKNGDKVLIYTEAKRAILYRPSTNKIIEIAPVRIGEDQPVTKDESTQESEPTETP